MQTEGDDAPPGTISPYGLDHVVAAYNTDRTSTGSRAILLKAMQALTTVAARCSYSSAQDLQGCGDLWWWPPKAVLEVSKDLSAAQLKSLTSETFQTTEVIGTTGNPGVQKFIFVPKNIIKLAAKGNKKSSQRIINIIGISLTWSVANNSTQTTLAANPAPTL